MISDLRTQLSQAQNTPSLSAISAFDERKHRAQEDEIQRLRESLANATLLQEQIYLYKAEQQKAHEREQFYLQIEQENADMREELSKLAELRTAMSSMGFVCVAAFNHKMHDAFLLLSVESMLLRLFYEFIDLQAVEAFQRNGLCCNETQLVCFLAFM